MKKLILAILGVVMMATLAFADVYVQGYTRSNGTYVAPHYRSSPNSSRYDNWSTKGNYNPHTGEKGSSNPFTQYTPSRKRSRSYGSF